LNYLKQNGKIVKVLKQLFFGAVVFCAVNVRGAGWVITSPNDVTTNAGASGTSTWIFDPTQSGNVLAGSTFEVDEDSPDSSLYWPTTPAAGDPFSSITIASAPSSFTVGVPFDVTLDWTTVTTANGGPSVPSEFEIDLELDTSDGYQGTSQNFNINPTPEPTVASLLLGCGAVGFAFRRLLKKRAV
jgi:hypothetical protein